jgi:hypothetical protein
MLPSGAVFERLRTNHLALADEDQRLLGALVAGLPVAEIAAAIFKAERSVRRDLQRIEELICIPAGVERARPAMAGWWFHEHSWCDQGCLAAIRDDLATGREFLSKG